MNEHKATDLKAAAVMADDYTPTHKKSDFNHKACPLKSHWSGQNGGKPQGKAGNDEKGSSQKVANDKPDNGKVEHRFPESSGKDRKSMFRKVCYHCKKSRHLMLDYWLLKKIESRTRKTSVGLINSN